jgi:hypothetical protein
MRTQGLIACMLFLLGCSRGPRLAELPELPARFPYHTTEQIRAYLRLPLDTLKAFSAQATVQLRSPTGIDNLSAIITARRDDSILIRFNAGWGIEAARLLITADSVFLHDRIHRRLYAGTRRDLMPYRLPIITTTQDPFLGLLGALYPPAGFWQVRIDSTYYLLQDTTGYQRYKIDPARWRVVRYERYDAAGHLVEVYHFEAFDRFGQVFLPRRLLIAQPLQGLEARLYYRELTLNPLSLQFTWNPAGAGRLPLSALSTQR